MLHDARAQGLDKLCKFVRHMCVAPAACTCLQFWMAYLRKTYTSGTLNCCAHMQVLIIDEVSMVSAEMLYLIDIHLQVVRDTLRPFGGVQIVLAGDFFQYEHACNDHAS